MNQRKRIATQTKVVPDYTPRKVVKEEEYIIPQKPCIICEKMTHGYGMFSEGVVCSRSCNETHMLNREKLIDHVMENQK